MYIQEKREKYIYIPYLKYQDFGFIIKINNSSLFFLCFLLLYQSVLLNSIWKI